MSDETKRPAPPTRPPPAAVPAPATPSARPGTVPPDVRAAQARAMAQVAVQRGRPPGPPAAAVAVGAPAQAPRSAVPQAVAAASRPPPPAAPKPKPEEPEFYPLEPRSWEEAGISDTQVMGLALRLLLGSTAQTGKNIAETLGLPLAMVREVLDRAKNEKLVTYRSTTVMGDFVSELTETGQAWAHESRKLTSYVGHAPVPWQHYVEAMKYQALTNKNPGLEDLQHAFEDLQISEDMYDRLGPAVTSGKAMFLFGEPGNGKTSLAERMTRCFGGTIWIPHTLDIGGFYVKLFDAAIHKPVDHDPTRHRGRDRRWIRIERPTVIAGGELTLDMLEIRYDATSRTCEAPMQLKANAGTLVIDDFGRGNTKPRDLLNRWIFPLEKKRDFLQIPDGRKVEAPFDALLVFSTNLEPRDLADEAFLRRIPYKIHVGDPSDDEFEVLVQKVAEKLGVTLEPRSVRYLVDRHYKMSKRPMRMCHPRDLLLQVVHLCEYERRPLKAGPAEWDRVAANYFGI